MNNHENRSPEEDGGFNYTYSAKEQAELKKIREKYLAETKTVEINKMEQIRLLDRSVTKGSTVFALSFGVIGALVMGFGMSLIMTDLKAYFSLTGITAMIIGILIGIFGMILILLAYPLYHFITEKKRKKIAPEILRLTEELLDKSQ